LRALFHARGETEQKEKTVSETQSPAKDVMSPEDLAEYLGCGRTYAYSLLRDGQIRSFKLGKLRRIRRQDVERYLEALATQEAKR
jgi:excisionase family DNA binding protein